jgi:hypothetical protein
MDIRIPPEYLMPFFSMQAVHKAAVIGHTIPIYRHVAKLKYFVVIIQYCIWKEVHDPPEYNIQIAVSPELIPRKIFCFS